MPPFYKHRSDPSPGEIRRGFHQNMFLSKKWIFFHLFGSLESWNSYPWRKIDEDELRKFITVASPGKIFLGAHNWLGPLTVYSNACKLRHWQSFYEDLLVMLNEGTPVSLTDSVRNPESQTWPYTLTRFAKTGWSLLKWFFGGVIQNPNGSMTLVPPKSVKKFLGQFQYWVFRWISLKMQWQIRCIVYSKGRLWWSCRKTEATWTARTICRDENSYSCWWRQGKL